MKRKIIIKNKKKHHHHHRKHQKKQQPQVSGNAGVTPENEKNDTLNSPTAGENGPPPDVIPQNDMADGDALGNEQQIGNGDISHPPMLQQRQGSKDSAQDDEGRQIEN